MVFQRQITSAPKAILLAGLIACLGTPLSAQVIYDNIPVPQPGNLPSQAFEATQTSEFGAGVVFSPGSSRVLSTVKVLMSSWGCVTGSWTDGSCVTAPGSTFSHPITLNIYAVGVGNTLGGPLASKTTTFAIPFRPSYDPVKCPAAPGQPGKWFDVVTNSCNNGLATPIVFDFTSSGITLPNQVIITVAFNTTHYGKTPLGQGTACFIAGNNCGYDSLNVGAENHLSVGSYLDPTGAFLNSATAGQYCIGGGPTGTLRPDLTCWGGFQPSFQVSAVANGAYLTKYFGNLNIGDSELNLTNSGASIGVPTTTGNICANLYVISADEQLVACCSCPVTPNGLISLSAKSLITNTLTPTVPSSMTVAILASANTGACNPAAPGVLVPGLSAWGTNLHDGGAVTETKFVDSTISGPILGRLTSLCGFLQANGSGYGICGVCRFG